MNEPKYKAGDKVRALIDWYSLKKGKIYEVKEVIEDRCSLWIDEEKTDYDIMCFHEIEPATEPATEYKKGDKVRALVDFEFLKQGEIYKVEEVLEDGCFLQRDKEKTHSGYDYMFFNEIEPVTKLATEPVTEPVTEPAITFEDFLTEIFIKDYGKMILDDNLPDAESNWLMNLSVEDWLMYGNDYKNA